MLVDEADDAEEQVTEAAADEADGVDAAGAYACRSKRSAPRSSINTYACGVVSAQAMHCVNKLRVVEALNLRAGSIIVITPGSRPVARAIKR